MKQMTTLYKRLGIGVVGLAGAVFVTSTALAASSADLCANGPGTLVTGDLYTFNGLTYKVVVGTEGNDTLNGFDDQANASERDILWGLGGDDTVNGGNGDDILCGASGADTLNGNSGNDSLLGGADNDQLNGGLGSDHLSGEGGSDQLQGQDGDDVDSIIIASGDRAGLYGGDGDDALYGGNGADWLAGQNGNDTLYGERGTDQLGGGPGFDTLDGGQNKDKCEGEVQQSCEEPLFP